MVAGVNRRMTSLLDPKTCWKDWMREGSLKKVRARLYENGIINGKTGQPPTISAIEKSAYSWAIENLEEARKDLSRAWSSEGIALTDEKWSQFLARSARLVHYQDPGKLGRFVEENELEGYV